MKVLLFPVLLAAAIATAPPKAPAGTRWSGSISNGLKGDKISFTVSPDGKKISNLTFDGYWRCSGKLERQVVHPEGSYAIREGEVSGVSVEALRGGTAAWHFAIEGGVAGKAAATGTFRISINNDPGCDTYVLQWSANR